MDYRIPPLITTLSGLFLILLHFVIGEPYALTYYRWGWIFPLEGTGNNLLFFLGIGCILIGSPILLSEIRKRRKISSDGALGKT